MPDPLEQLDPDRLFAAIEAIYQAASEMSSDGGMTVYPPDLLGTPQQPRAFSDFTRFEIEEAAHFLVRMGLIVPDDGSASEEGRRCA